MHYRLAACLVAISGGLFSTLLAAPAQAGPALQRIRDTGVIRIAHRESSVPFSYLDDKKRPVGYAVDLCLRIADGVKAELKLPALKVEYLAVTSADRIPAIVDGKADLECGSTTNNRERRDKVAFTIPHYIAGSRMIVKTASGIRNWPDLRGKTVVTTKGTTSVAVVQRMNDSSRLGVKVLEAKDHAEAFAMVAAGTADAFVMDDVLLYGFRANAPQPADYAVTGDMLTIEPYAIMLRKDDPEFKKIVDKVMIGTIYDFEIQKIYARWFQAAIPPRNVKLDIPMSYLLRDSFKFPSDKVAD
jgi:glutamate/aspartate transport system substrate-binding protein